MKRITLSIITLVLSSLLLFSQGFNIPARHWGISLGNSTLFNGLRWLPLFNTSFGS